MPGAGSRCERQVTNPGSVSTSSPVEEPASFGSVGVALEGDSSPLSSRSDSAHSMQTEPVVDVDASNPVQDGPRGIVAGVLLVFEIDLGVALWSKIPDFQGSSRRWLFNGHRKCERHALGLGKVGKELSELVIKVGPVRGVVVVHLISLEPEEVKAGIGIPRIEVDLPIQNSVKILAKSLVEILESFAQERVQEATLLRVVSCRLSNVEVGGAAQG